MRRPDKVVLIDHIVYETSDELSAMFNRCIQIITPSMLSTILYSRTSYTGA